MTFDKRQTNIAKGVAALLLLWHHVFSDIDITYDRITSLLFVGGRPLVCFVSPFCKVCVAIFCILTGFGLFKSFSKYSEKHIVGVKLPLGKQLAFVKNHLLNMMSKYWFVYIVFSLLGVAIGLSRFGLYEGDVLNAVIDFFGLASLFGTPTINATWWFMYMIIIFYIGFPIVYKLFTYSSELVLGLSFLLLVLPSLPYVTELQKYQFCFILGMYISKNNGLERLLGKVDSIWKRVYVCVVSIIAIVYVRSSMHLGNRFDAFFGIAIIFASFAILSRIPVLNKILEELGKYSALIFMSHTFIYSYYFRDFIYWFKYPPVILIVLTVVSYGVARLLDYVMKLIRYNKLFELITSTKREKA